MGLLIGMVISLLGIMFENEFIQIAGGGMGLALGITLGALFYSIQARKG